MSVKALAFSFKVVLTASVTLLVILLGVVVDSLVVTASVAVVTESFIVVDKELNVDAVVDEELLGIAVDIAAVEVPSLICMVVSLTTC